MAQWYDQTSSGVVRVEAYQTPLDWRRPDIVTPQKAGVGTGFFVPLREGGEWVAILTCAHVLDGCLKDQISIVFPKVGMERWQTAFVHCLVPEYDLGIIVMKLPQNNIEVRNAIRPLPLMRNQNGNLVGQKVSAYGYPLGKPKLKYTQTTVLGVCRQRVHSDQCGHIAREQRWPSDSRIDGGGDRCQRYDHGRYVCQRGTLRRADSAVPSHGEADAVEYGTESEDAALPRILLPHRHRGFAAQEQRRALIRKSLRRSSARWSVRVPSHAGLSAEKSGHEGGCNHYRTINISGEWLVVDRFGEVQTIWNGEQRVPMKNVLPRVATDTDIRVEFTQNSQRMEVQVRQQPMAPGSLRTMSPPFEENQTTVCLAVSA